MASGGLFHEFFEMSRIEQRRDGEGSKVIPMCAMEQAIPITRAQ
jgi:hypothetical protein